jgi:hypothetical protein
MSVMKNLSLTCVCLVFLLGGGVLLLSACDASVSPAYEPENGAAERSETARPGNSPPNEDDPSGKPNENETEPTPDETMAGIKILTFDTETYSIQYPNYWDLQEGEEATGYEALTFWKKDPDVYAEGGKGIQDPNSAKASLSIMAKGEKSLNDIALAELEFTGEDISSENLDIGGKRAVRYFSSFGEEQIVNTYIDWNETEYIWLAGYHGTGSERDTMRRDVLFIHDSLREAGTER